MDIEDEGAPVELYHVCGGCGHFWLTEEADHCERCHCPDGRMKPLVQVLAENGYEGDAALLVPGLFLGGDSFAFVKTLVDSRTPVSVHASQDGEWLATLRLEDLLAMIPAGYGTEDAE
jgi:hypothetical protein